MMRYAFTLLALCCRLSAAPSAWTQIGPGLRMLKIGSFATGSYINVNIARDMALVSSDGVQYSTYYDPQGQLVVSKRRLESTQSETALVPCQESGPSVLLDPHHYASIQIDGDGYLHLAYDHHGSSMHYRRSLRPKDIRSWEPERGLSLTEPEQSVSYVSLIRLKSGNLLALFRSGIAGKGTEAAMHYDLKTRAWSRLAYPLISGNDHSSPYLWRAVVSPDGTIHIAWTWRYSKFDGMPDSPFVNQHFSGFSNRDIHYACSHDEGRHWQRSDGSTYELPIINGGTGAHAAEKILDLPMGEDFFNHYGSDYGPDGRPHFAYSHWNNPQDRIAQQWEIYLSPQGWKTVQVSDYKSQVTWLRHQQDGLTSTWLCRPSLLMDAQGRCLLFSRSHERGDRIELFVSPPGDKGPWAKHILFDGSAGGWEPQMDLDLWHHSHGRHLQLLLAGITDATIAKAWGYPGGFLEKLKELNPWRDRAAKQGGYYSLDHSITVLHPDLRLEENTGYILDVDLKQVAP